MPKAGCKVKPEEGIDFAAVEIWFDRVRNKCVKCLSALSTGEFVVNKDMAYCDECAAILHLGESKESRMFRDFQDPDGAAADGAPADGETPDGSMPIGVVPEEGPGGEAVEVDGPPGPDFAGVALEEGGGLEE